MAVGQTNDQFIEGLKSSDAKVRRASVEKLGRKRVESAIPAIRDRLKDDDAAVRAAAADALVRFGTKGAKPLAEALSYSKEESKGEALRALYLLGANAKDALPAVMPILKDKTRDNRIYAAVILGQLGSDGKPALEALFEAAKDTANAGSGARMPLPMSVKALKDGAARKVKSGTKSATPKCG